jgi:hypothetical protein
MPSRYPGNSGRTRVTPETKSGLGYEPNLYRRARRELGADFRYAGAGPIRVTSANASLPCCRLRRHNSILAYISSKRCVPHHTGTKSCPTRQRGTIEGGWPFTPERRLSRKAAVSGPRSA